MKLKVTVNDVAYDVDVDVDKTPNAPLAPIMFGGGSGPALKASAGGGGKAGAGEVPAPLAGTVPAFATAPALLFVAVLMTSGLAEIDWDDITVAAPVVITALAMPLTFSIANGIALGFLTYATLKLLTGQRDKVSISLYVLCVIFIAKFAFL